MYLYIFFEVTYLFLILINFMLDRYSEIFRIGPTIISVIYIFITKIKKEKINIYLILSIIFSLCGDILFLSIDKHTLGIASFIIVQMYYLFFLRGKSSKISLLILINFIISIIFGKKVQIIESVIYVIFFIINITFLIKNIKTKKISPLFLVALLSLLICDINVVIINKVNLSKSLKIICSSIEWIFYTLNIVIVTLLAKGIITNKIKI